MEDLRKEYKLVFNAGVAKRLLEQGNPIYSIKPDKHNRDKTVFVFKRTPEFEKAFTRINDEIAESKKGTAVE